MCVYQTILCLACIYMTYVYTYVCTYIHIRTCVRVSKTSCFWLVILLTYICICICIHIYIYICTRQKPNVNCNSNLNRDSLCLDCKTYLLFQWLQHRGSWKRGSPVKNLACTEDLFGNACLHHLFEGKSHNNIFIDTYVHTSLCVQTCT